MYALPIQGSLTEKYLDLWNKDDNAYSLFLHFHFAYYFLHFQLITSKLHNLLDRINSITISHKIASKIYGFKRLIFKECTFNDKVALHFNV